MRCFSKAMIATAALFASVLPVAAQNHCFNVTQFNNWRAPDDHTIFIRVSLSHYYRLDLASTCSMLRWPDAHLIMNVHGPDTICSAVDWDLKVSQDMHSIPEPCIVKAMTLLSPAEAAAIPRKFKP